MATRWTGRVTQVAQVRGAVGFLLVSTRSLKGNARGCPRRRSDVREAVCWGVTRRVASRWWARRRRTSPPWWCPPSSRPGGQRRCACGREPQVSCGDGMGPPAAALQRLRGPFPQLSALWPCDRALLLARPHKRSCQRHAAAGSPEPWPACRVRAGHGARAHGHGGLAQPAPLWHAAAGSGCAPSLPPTSTRRCCPATSPVSRARLPALLPPPPGSPGGAAAAPAAGHVPAALPLLGTLTGGGASQGASGAALTGLPQPYRSGSGGNATTSDLPQVRAPQHQRARAVAHASWRGGQPCE